MTAEERQEVVDEVELELILKLCSACADMAVYGWPRRKLYRPEKDGWTWEHERFHPCEAFAIWERRYQRSR